MKLSLLILLSLFFSSARSQPLGVEFRTVRELNVSLYYLIFQDQGKCILKLPNLNHGQAMMGVKGQYPLTYKFEHDTITIAGIKDSQIIGVILGRLLKARFIIKNKNLYDCTSGYIYVDRKSVSDKYSIYIIDGKIYRQKAMKTNGYGEVVKEFGQNRRLKRKMRSIRIDEYEAKIVNGPEAFEKYGEIGMNGVIVIEKKN